MAPDDRTGNWQRHERASTVSDALQHLRMTIVAIREAPGDAEHRRRLRALAADQGLWEQLAGLLADEVRAHADRPAIAAAFHEELADVHEVLGQPLETIAALEALVAIAPEVVAHHERIAHLYRQAGAWAKAADAFAQVALRASDARADGALLAAAQLDRDHDRLDRAVVMYRRLVERRPADPVAWRGLDDVLSELGRWREVAAMRGERAARASSGFEKAALLRAQARALAQAGDAPAAADVIVRAATHAPDELGGLVDQAEGLARDGQGAQAAELLRARIADAVARGASADDVAALRLWLAQVLEDACDDRTAATAVLDELLAAAPAHLRALERLTALAATDPDPRVHAIALLRYAAAVPGAADRASYVAAAGRRLREVGDLEGAVQALEHAAALVGEDEALQRELVDVRTSAWVAQARSDAAAGDTRGAEWRLRELLGAQRHHLEANLAFADLLAATRRGVAAAEHLRETLATMPEDRPPAQAARLVLRYAEVMGALGEADDSHQLLHEAHRLDRSSLAVTLALGESCFARRLWRQAALHLAAAGGHPDAPRHAAVVAAALVHAAQAEVRALRPANAGKHYEAATRLDRGCAPAWRGLAQLASERGDVVHAADCLEREAAATAEPRERLRLYDALGDLALDVLADPVRAERCWREVAGAGSATLLQKLCAVQRQRGATVERADTCERLARLAADAESRQALLVEAAEALLAGKAVERAVTVVDEVLAMFPREPDVVVWATTMAVTAGDARRAGSWARRLIHGGEPEDLRAGLELASAIGVPLSADDRRFLDAHPARPMASDQGYLGSLDDADCRALVDDPGERPLRDVLALLGEALPLIGPNPSAALLEAGVPDAVRVTASSEAAATALYPHLARALGGPPTLLYTTSFAGIDLALLFASPPVVVFGPALASVRAGSRGDGHQETDAALRFQLGRTVELSRPHRLFAAMPEDALALLVAGLQHGLGRPQPPAASGQVMAEAERLRSRLSVALRQRLTERLAALGPSPLDPRAYVAACQRAADRAGLLACGDVTVAIQLAGGARRAPHLVQLAASRRYLAIRKKLRSS